MAASIILTRIFWGVFLPFFLPEPNHEDGRDLIHGENDRRKNEPKNVHVAGKEENESGDPAGREKNGRREQEDGSEVFHLACSIVMGTISGRVTTGSPP